jgi:hypothetical protein
MRRNLNHYLIIATVSAIHNIPWWTNDQKDRWAWLKSSTGELSVKSVNQAARRNGTSAQSNSVLGKIWKLSLHARLKMFLWRVAMNILPTRASLSRFVPNMDSSYPICGHQLETLIHLLWTCPLARALWFNSAWGIKTDSFQLDSPIQLIENLISPSVSLNLNRN